MSNTKLYGLEIEHAGDTWKIIGAGASHEGRIYCHLASKTRGTEQKNGWRAIQAADWISEQIILAALESKGA